MQEPRPRMAAGEAALQQGQGDVSGPTGAAVSLGIPRSTPESKFWPLKIDENPYQGKEKAALLCLRCAGDFSPFGENPPAVGVLRSVFSTE
jgi:hypothetical protein